MAVEKQGNFRKLNTIKSMGYLIYVSVIERYTFGTMYALNRGEAYNGLYRGITLLRKGELRGLSEIEMTIWHQCTRLISSIILYYNTYILNALFEKAETEEERQFIAKHTPCARAHINLLGHYEFCQRFYCHEVDDFIKGWDWQRNLE